MCQLANLILRKGVLSLKNGNQIYLNLRNYFPFQVVTLQNMKEFFSEGILNVLKKIPPMKTSL
jgi:3-polyprenyl-4-hydroxybenzoate decarboxylase